MRFEAKNKELKQYTSNCFKNVPCSISVQHQQSACHLLSSKYITSWYCMSELYTANGDQKRIFPVIVENVDFVALLSLPGVSSTLYPESTGLCFVMVPDIEGR